MIAVSFLTACILSTCEKKRQPQVNQEELRMKAQKDSIEKARYYEWLYGGSEPDSAECKGDKSHKVSSTSYSKELEYYDEHFDDYHDDPEDGITYPDDIFDYLDD
jgi:hypothetical protein